MARRPEPKPRKRSFIEVRAHPFDGAKNLITIGPDDPIWRAPDFLRPFHKTIIDGARFFIVRLRPPATATDDNVALVKQAFAECAAVHLDPRPRAAVIPEAVLHRGAPRGVGQREAVLQLAKESYVQSAAFYSLLEETMSKVGL